LAEVAQALPCLASVPRAGPNHRPRSPAVIPAKNGKKLVSLIFPVFFRFFFRFSVFLEKKKIPVKDCF
jgi:hypothetical protein